MSYIMVKVNQTKVTLLQQNLTNRGKKSCYHRCFNYLFFPCQVVVNEYRQVDRWQPVSTDLVHYDG